MLKRAPFFLRVVEKAGAWDALDQVDDEPSPAETLHAYQLTAKPGMAHLNFGRKGGGWYPMATYREVKVQPADYVMRDNEQWTQWCEDRRSQATFYK